MIGICWIQHLEEHHAQGVVKPTIDVNGTVQRLLDGSHHIAAQIGDKLGRLLELVANDGQVQHRTESIQPVLNATQYLVYRIDDDGRVTQQKNQRTIDQLVRVITIGNRCVEHLCQLGLPIGQIRHDQADVKPA